MLLEIVTPDEKVYSGEVEMVEVPGTAGRFQVLNNHAPIISTLTQGQVKVRDIEKNTQAFDISGGVIEVLKNNIVVLAESV